MQLLKLINTKYKNFLEKGQTLVEVLLAIGLAAIIFPAILTGVVASRSGKPQELQRIQAIQFLKESEEAIKSIRNNNWNAITTDGTYYATTSGNAWMLVSGTQTINGLTQRIDISDVNRASTGAIVASPAGTLDPSTKQIAITISWTQPYASSITSTLYLTHQDNISDTDTTTTDFNAGNVLSGVAVVNTIPSGTPNDGQVQLGAGGHGDWCQPATPTASLTYNLPGSAIATAITTFVGANKNTIYSTTGGNSSGNPMESAVVSDPPNPSPPVISYNGSYTTENIKTYGLYADSQYAYLAAANPGPSVDILNIQNPPNFTKAGYFDPGGTGTSVYVANNTSYGGNVGYVTIGSKLYTFDLKSIQGSSSQTQLGVFNLAGTGNKVFVVGTTVYIATSSTTKQLQIINALDPTRLTDIADINLGNSLGANDVYVSQAATYAYVVTNYLSTEPDLFIIDLSNNTIVGNYTTVQNMSPKAVVAIPGNRVAIGGSSGQVYQVIDVSNASVPVRCGGITIPGVNTIYAISPVIETDGDHFSYILTDNASAEVQIVEGGSGGTYSSSGTFESRNFALTQPPTHQMTFNRLVATINQPSNTTIQIQVAASQAVNGNCNNATYTYVGPNGNPASYFTPVAASISAAIPFGNYNPSYTNPGWCMRYKAYFTTNDSNLTPVLYDVSVNHSP